MIWLCKFQGGINGWDLKILYRNLESWKKWLKKNGMEWNSLKKNEMEWNSWKNEKWEWNGMEEMGYTNIWLNYFDHPKK